MDASCKAICQLPHSQWPIQVDVLPISPPLKDTGKLRIQITQNFTSLSQWLQYKFKITLSRDELIVPDRCIVYNSLSKLTVQEQDGETFKDSPGSITSCKNHVFHFLGDKYDFTQVNSMRVDDHVFWPFQNLLLFGKVRFTGINRNTRFQNDGDNIAVFVSFATTEYLFGKCRDWENGNHVYKVDPKELYTFQEIHDLHQKTRGLTVYPSLISLNGSQIVEFSISGTETMKQDLISVGEGVDAKMSGFPANDLSHLGGETTISNAESNATSNPTPDYSQNLPMKTDLESSVTRPLEKMKVNKSLLEQMDKDDYKWKQYEEITSLGRQKSIDNLEINEPYEKTSIIPSTKETEHEHNRNKNEHKNSQSAVEQSENHGNLSTPIVFPEGKLHLIGNCVAVQMGIKVLTGDLEIKKGDMIVAVNRSIHTTFLGNVQLACVINGLEKKIQENCAFVGVRFTRPLMGFEILHANSELVSGQCKQCEGDRLLFISWERIKNKNFDKEQLFHYMPVESAYKEENTVLDTNPSLNRENSVFVNEIIPVNQYTREDLSRVGIEGRSNSCYADSFLFALFAFTNVFDGCLERDKNPEKEETELDRRSGVICDVVKFDIASPLRKKEKVGWRSMQKLRQQLGHYDSSCVSSVMDIEEFALILFEKGFQTTPFLEFDGDTMDYIYQVFVTPEDVSLSKEEIPKLQNLLEYSFQEQMVKLVKTPSPAFIVKLPVSDGKPSFPKIFPNLEISLGGICEEKESVMVLRTVICLRNSHFTCFVRASKDDSTYTWLYFDSMTSGSSMVTEIPTLEEKLLQFSSIPQETSNPLHRRKRSLGKKQRRPDWIDKLLSSAYMCIYEPKLENLAVHYEYTSDESL